MPIRREVSLGGFFGGGISFRMSFSCFSVEVPTTSFYGIAQCTRWGDEHHDARRSYGLHSKGWLG